MLIMSSCGSVKGGRLKYRKVTSISAEQEKLTQHTNHADAEAQLPKLAPVDASIQNQHPEYSAPEKTISKVPRIELTTKDTLTNNNCDKLTMNDGKEISVKIIEIGIDQIKYKRCEFLEGPTYSIKANNVTSIMYSNGTKEDMTKNIGPAPKPRAHIAGLVLGIVGLNLGIALAIILSQMLLLIAAGLGLLAIILAISTFVLLKKDPNSKNARTLGAISAVIGGLSLVALTITFLLAIIL